MAHSLIEVSVDILNSFSCEAWSALNSTDLQNSRKKAVRKYTHFKRATQNIKSNPRISHDAGHRGKVHQSGRTNMAGFCWTSCRERNPEGAGSLYERIKRDDTKSIYAPKGFRDAPTHKIESSCRFSTFLFHPLFVYILHNYSVGISCKRHFLAQSRAFCRSYVCIYHVHPDGVPETVGH